MTDFITEFNKYNIHTITVEEYENHQKELNRKGYRENYAVFMRDMMDKGFIFYNGIQYFQYSKKELLRLVNIINNPDKNIMNDVIKNVFETYNQVYAKYILDTFMTGNITIHDKCKFVIEYVIVPKYYEEIQKTMAETKVVVEVVKPSEVAKTEETNDKPKKKTIPLSLKRSVWNKHIGEEIGKAVCLCCKITCITQMSFSCGHVIAEYNGGELKLENLKPICVSCNSSMGTQNMNEFIKQYGL
jgi:hypothetical protein